MTEDEIYVELEAAGIPFEKLEHAAVFSEPECAVIQTALPAAHTKNLFLKDRRGTFWIIVLPSDCRADLKAFAAAVGVGKFSFGKPDDLQRVLKISPGSVTPIAAANAPGGLVRVVFDASFCSSERIAVHPLRNTATIALAFDSLLSWLNGRGVAFEVAALPSIRSEGR